MKEKGTVAILVGGGLPLLVQSQYERYGTRKVMYPIVRPSLIYGDGMRVATSFRAAVPSIFTR